MRMRRTTKQIEGDLQIIASYVEEGDLLGANLVASLLERDYAEAGDVFGNRCRCRMNDDGEWVDAFCPEHPEPDHD